MVKELSFLKVILVASWTYNVRSYEQVLFDKYLQIRFVRVNDKQVPLTIYLRSCKIKMVLQTLNQHQAIT